MYDNGTVTIVTGVAGTSALAATGHMMAGWIGVLIVALVVSVGLLIRTRRVAKAEGAQ
jgi:hypothetical protein